MVNRSSRRVCHSLTSKPKPFTCTLLREVDLRDPRRYFRTRCGICWSSRGTKNTRLCSRCGHPFACYARSWNETLEYGFLGSGSQGPPQSLVGFFSFLSCSGWKPQNLRYPKAEGPESSSDEEQDLPGILGEVQEILQGQARVQTAVPRRERGSQKKGAKGHVRRSSLQKIRDKFRFLLAKFTRANREPIILSDGLTFEREDTGVSGTNFVELFD